MKAGRDHIPAFLERDYDAEPDLAELTGRRRIGCLAFLVYSPVLLLAGSVLSHLGGLA